MEEILRPVLTCLLIWATWLFADRGGWLEGKSLSGRALILLPAFLVVVLLFELVWQQVQSSG
jgi:type VI protein secretion system component VasK